MNVLQQVLERMRHSHHTQMADVSTLNLLRQMFEQSHQGARQDAQVDAMMRCKYGDDYSPPERDDEDMNVYMNSIITDKKSLSKIAQQNDGKASGSRLPWIAGMLGTAGLAAALTAYLMPGGDDTNTQNTLRPANPSQIVNQ